MQQKKQQTAAMMKAWCISGGLWFWAYLYQRPTEKKKATLLKTQFSQQNSVNGTFSTSPHHHHLIKDTPMPCFDCGCPHWVPSRAHASSPQAEPLKRSVGCENTAYPERGMHALKHSIFSSLRRSRHQFFRFINKVKPAHKIPRRQRNTV